MPAVIAALRMWCVVALVFAQFAIYFVQPTHQRLAPTPPTAPLAPQQGQPIRISQVYGGGDATGAVVPCDFVELFNASDQPFSLKGWSLQYKKYPSGTIWYLTKFGSVTIAPHGYFLVVFTCGNGSLPGDLVGSSSTLLATTQGKVALASTEKAITNLNDPAVVDFVGYGPVDEYEGSGPTPGLTVQTAALRGNGGCTDTDNNAADFSVGAPTPRNSGSPSHNCTDPAPQVQSTTPAPGATSVARDANLLVTFSEPVSVTGEWFSVQCDLSGSRSPQSAAVTGNSVTYTIDPNVSFWGDDSCVMTIFAAGISDADGNDPPDTLSSDYVLAFKTAPGQCGDPAYGIGGVQGAGEASPVAGQQRTLEGIVTGDFQGPNALAGFFLQEEPAQADGDPLTSEAIFVDEHDGALGEVASGSRVRVTGTVSEASGLTSLTAVSHMVDCGAAEPLTPVQLALPLTVAWEQYEAMLVQFTQPLTVSDSAQLGSHGQLRLVAGGLAQAYTQSHAPDPAGFLSWETTLASRTLLLDDDSDMLYPDPIMHPAPGLTASNAVRASDLVQAGLTGILDLRAGGHVIQPVAQPVFLAQNPRTPAPVRTAGNIRAAFIDLDDYFKVAVASRGARGPSNAEEYARQRAKVVQALVALNADVIGLSKIANDGYGPDATLVDLTDALNAQVGADAYIYVDANRSGWGTDQVAVALIYRRAALAPIGEPAIHETGAFTQNGDERLHNAPMAQLFEEKTWGERFVVVVNEWHGRTGCPVDGANADAGDGQACWNAARTDAAEDLADWLTSDPTGGDPDVLILGQLNAFPKEDPIQALYQRQYTDLIESYLGLNVLTTLVDGSAGVTAHALASPSLTAQAVGASIWNINADEPSALDYQLENKSTAQRESLYAPDPYRSARQNPLVTDFNLLPDQSDLAGSYGTAWHTGQGIWRLGESWGGADDGMTPGPDSWNDGQGEITVTVHGPQGHYACLYGWLDYSDGTIIAGTAEEPNGVWDANEKVLAGVPLLSGQDQPVTFALPAGSIKSSGALNIRLRLIPAPNPATANCAINAPNAMGATLEPTGRADGGEVEDHIIEMAPLAVALASFTAQIRSEGVLISWETTSEENVAGFNLHRFDPLTGAWRRINQTTIASRTPGASQGQLYEWVDRAAARGQGVAYKLEEVTFAGSSTLYGPVEPLEPLAVTVSQMETDKRTPFTGALLLLGLLTAAGILALRLHAR